MSDVTERFSNRVENYVKYRPGYPPEVSEALADWCGLNANSVVADIGSGTGIFSELLLKSGCQVIGIEPNREMRLAGERLLSSYPRFRSLAATAEATTLADRSVELITAGQAFHWFDQAQARQEFERILKPGGWVALIWNERKLESTPFLIAYETMLRRFGTDYEQVTHRDVDEAMLTRFFAPGNLRTLKFGNRQVFGLEGMIGRLLSSSYVPEAGQPNHEPMLAEARRIFEVYAEGGQVAFEYETMLYLGQFQ